MRILTRRDLQSLLTPAAALVALEAAFRAAAEGRVQAPVRLPVEIPGSAQGAGGVVLYMPAALAPGADPADPGAVGAKVVSVFADNPSRGLPLIHGVYLLTDAATGRPAALLEAGWLTALRTAAASALAATRLARDDAGSLALVGAGVQAAAHLDAFLGIRPIRHVRIASRSAARAEAFVADARRRYPDLDIALARDANSAVEACDVVVAATTSATPVVHGAGLRPGAFVALVGAFTPRTREADTEAIQRARVFVDTYDGALAEAGDLLIPMGEGAFERTAIAGDLAGLVSGRVVGRRNRDEVTLFKSVGAALEDLAVAGLAARLAAERGVGQVVTL
jgi:ornithine cyclodeaminase